MRLSAPSLGRRLVGWFGVRLSAPSKGLRLVGWFWQELIEPAKPAREHATSIDGEIQTLASGY